MENCAHAGTRILMLGQRSDEAVWTCQYPQKVGGMDDMAFFTLLAALMVETFLSGLVIYSHIDIKSTFKYPKVGGFIPGLSVQVERLCNIDLIHLH